MRAHGREERQGAMVNAGTLILAGLLLAFALPGSLVLLIRETAVSAAPEAPARTDLPPTPPATAPEAAPKVEESGPKVSVLALEEEVRGLPDQKEGTSIRQKLYIDSDGGRLILIAYLPDPPGQPNGAAPGETQAERPVDRRIILNLKAEPLEVFEVWDGEKTFRRTSKDLNTLQEERNEYERGMLRHLPELTSTDQAATLRENFLMPDGSRRVEVIHLGTKQKVLEYDCERVKVLENNRTVIDAWITTGDKRVKGAKSFFELYRRLGAFSQEVLNRVKDIDGLPLAADITVVTVGPAYQIQARCLSLQMEKVPEAWFRVPAGYKPKSDELPPVVPCAICGKDVERKETPHRRVVDGTPYYLCSLKCQEAFDKKMEGSRKKKAAEDDEGAAPVRRPK